MLKREKLVSSATSRPASWQRASSAVRVSTTLPLAEIAKRVLEAQPESPSAP